MIYVSRDWNAHCTVKCTLHYYLLLLNNWRIEKYIEQIRCEGHREIRSVVGLVGGSATSVVLYSGLRILRICSRTCCDFFPTPEILAVLQARTRLTALLKRLSCLANRFRFEERCDPLGADSTSVDTKS